MKASTLAFGLFLSSLLALPVQARTPEDGERQPRESKAQEAKRGQANSLDRRAGTVDPQRSRAEMVKRFAQAQGRQLETPRAGFAGADPAMMVTRMIDMFDKDNDQKLDARELTEMLSFIRERGAGMMAQRSADERPGAAADAQRRRRFSGGDKSSDAGGDKPSRPASE